MGKHTKLSGRPVGTVLHASIPTLHKIRILKEAIDSVTGTDISLKDRRREIVYGRMIFVTIASTYHKFISHTELFKVFLPHHSRCLYEDYVRKLRDLKARHPDVAELYDRCMAQYCILMKQKGELIPKSAEAIVVAQILEQLNVLVSREAIHKVIEAANNKILSLTNNKGVK